MFSLEAKLKKLKEKGFGKSIFFSFISEKEPDNIPFSDQISSVWKQTYFFLEDEEDSRLLENKFVNSINEYPDTKYFVFDYLSFVLFLKNYERIIPIHSGIQKIVVYNPVNYSISLKNKLLSYVNLFVYRDMLGKEAKVHDSLEIWSYKILDKLHHVEVDEFLVIGLEENKYGLKIASKVKNSRFVSNSSYKNALETLLNEFN